MKNRLPRAYHGWDTENRRKYEAIHVPYTAGNRIRRVMGGVAVIAILTPGAAATGGAQTAAGVSTTPAAGGRAFYFTRAIFSDVDRRARFGWWSVDYPKADRQFLIGLTRLTGIDAYHEENPVRLDDPHLRRFPLIYAVEVGHMALTDTERAGLRDYLLAGGMLLVDDFWGSWEWANFQGEMARVLPGYGITDIPLDHPLFHVFYDLREIVQVPNVGLGRAGGRTWEKDGYVPALRGIVDQHGRLMVVINWNSDLGDAWEWAEDPYYPLQYSNFAYQLGVNVIVYAMSH